MCIETSYLYIINIIIIITHKIRVDFASLGAMLLPYGGEPVPSISSHQG